MTAEITEINCILKKYIYSNRKHLRLSL